MELLGAGGGAGAQRLELAELALRADEGVAGVFEFAVEEALGGGAGADRPDSTEQLNLFVKALMRRGAVDDAVSELNAWLGARGQKLTEQPYNTLLKLAMDDELPSSVAFSSGLLQVGLPLTML